MLVYGDHADVVDGPAVLKGFIEDGADFGALQGLALRAAVFRVFLRLSSLLQGWADAESEAAGDIDDVSDAQDQLMAVLVELARAFDEAWTHPDEPAPSVDLERLRPLVRLAPHRLTLKHPEGFAYYALYPELYLQAARGLPNGCVVIGLRSIGVGLAALVAAVADARACITVRPRGEPFARSLDISSALRARILDDPQATFVLVDEGPGLSGSSLGGAADWLESQGVPAERIVFMPSHSGDLGPHAQPHHRARWDTAERRVASFEAVILNAPGAPLAAWFEDVAGKPTRPLKDLSGGAWRKLSPWPDAPADPSREARKYRLTTERGLYLLSFVGLDATAEEKLERARALSRAGFAPEPLALRHGFLLEPWIDGGAPERRQIVQALGPYLAFRASAFPAPHQGATLNELFAMARQNLREALGDAAPDLGAWTERRLEQLQAASRPVHIDGRLHRWEWLQGPGGVLKTDAVDHSQSHDLIGPQDIAWDVAGAVVEFDLSAAERSVLLSETNAAPELCDFMTVAYLGFQVGWWSMAQDPSAAREVSRYVQATLRLS
ncbi:hypothetical protein [Brevundimonas sp. PAMC22021]|uniref:hypothetical protein n=1 Tax=Brevundimonas sp. PAMC22021 TaxID=2861285 RepID=UPI001C63A37B|nr:hypothetical protein [Brevundimonas sp. PAMC22021]QYF87799.1 hypothetical protein KY493_04715 [Brevundimonas sp. PAMC22021]